MREGRREIGRHRARDQEGQCDEPEAVQDEQRSQRFGRCRTRSCGQYRAVTIPHAMKLNAMLRKKQSCGGMSASLIRVPALHWR